MYRILIAGLLAGLAIFVWESFTHMATPLGQMGMSPLPDEMAVREALGTYIGNADGLYFFPYMSEMNQQPSPGPWGLLVYHPQWNFSWAALGWEGLTHAIQGIALALIMSFAAIASFGRRFALALLIGVIVAVGVPPSYTIWYGFPIAYTIAQMIVAFGDYFVAGLVVAWMIKPQAAAPAAG
jgi:hypothetical protein